MFRLLYVEALRPDGTKEHKRIGVVSENHDGSMTVHFEPKDIAELLGCLKFVLEPFVEERK